MELSKRLTDKYTILDEVTRQVTALKILAEVLLRESNVWTTFMKNIHHLLINASCTHCGIYMLPQNLTNLTALDPRLN